MKKYYWLLPAILILFFCFVISCKKDMQLQQPVVFIDSSATYKMTITGNWKSPQHIVPAGNHFTQFIGMVHNAGTHLFQLGTPASKGVEDVAEVGNSIALNNEIAGYISGNQALNKFNLSLPNITGTDSAIIHFSFKNPTISFVSMIAPSPDWFVGVDSYSLFQKDNWVKDVTIQAAGYDAGTENGDIFSYDNPDTSPQQPVSYLTPANASVIANSNSIIAPFVTIRFVKL